MKAELVQPANNSWSRKLGSLAISATGTFPELRGGNPDTYSAFQTHNHYYNAIHVVLDAAHRRDAPFISRIADRQMRSPNFRSKSTRSFTALASGDMAMARKYYERTEPLHMAKFTEIIDELAQAEPDPVLRSDIEQVSSGIANNDKKLKLKITLDGLRTTLENTDLHQYTKRVVFRKITEAMIPELQGQHSSVLTPEFLFELQNYGLMEYVNLNGHLTIPFGIEDIGHKYRMNMSFMGRPRQEDVSAIPLLERTASWEQESREYSDQRSHIAQQLNILEQHQNPRKQESFSGYDEQWVAANLDKVSGILNSVLENNVTSRIIDTCDKSGDMPALDLFRHSPRLFSGNINGLRMAIESILEHTRDFPTQDNINHLMTALVGFRNLTMGLFNLESK